MRGLWLRTLLSLLAIALLSSSLCMAEQRSDRVQIGRDIHVQPGDRSGDLVCIGCSIYVRGHTAGDVVAVAGSVTLEDGAQVAGDTVAVLGSVRLQNAAQVAGDVTAVAGDVRRDPTAKIAGQVTSLGGAGWILLIVVMPLIMFGALIALIVWLLQRSRVPVPAPAYPGGTPSTRS